VVLRLAKDHTAGASLYRGGNSHLHVLADASGPVLDYDHCAVVKVSDPLAGILSFFHNGDLKFLAGQINGFEGVCEVVNI